jgi:hypothetical protein
MLTVRYWLAVLSQCSKLRQQSLIASFDVFTAVLMMIQAFRDVRCWSVNSNRRFGKSCWLHLQGLRDRRFHTSDEISEDMISICRMRSGRSHPPQKPSGLNLKFAMINFHTPVRNRTPPHDFSQLDLPTSFSVGEAVSWINLLHRIATLPLINVKLFNAEAEMNARVYGKIIWLNWPFE